ncbi:MAG TPA: chloride channel protein [Gemmatimonadaceae bacterium]|nr:chloride channel protein [Gemmatimonadaceae bacterium]
MRRPALELVVRVRRHWRRLVEQLPLRSVDEGVVLMVFGAAIGAVVGLGVVTFFRLVDLAYWAFARWPAQQLGGLGSALYRPLLTAAGLTCAWAIVRRLRLPDGQNVPDVQLAVAKRDGQVPFAPVAGRTLAAAVTLGSGGSAGSEGPVAVLGAALGSRVGRLFQFQSRQLKILVGCGAAAGISGAFDAPFAGAFFALEEVLGSFGVGAFSPVVVASVAGALVVRALLGPDAVIDVPAYGSVSPLVIVLLYPLLGIACGVASALFSRLHLAGLEVGARWRGPAWLRPALGGLVVGLLALLAGDVLVGDGHLRIPMTDFARLAWWMLLGVAVVKMAMTALTFAAGGSGGVFTPTLFIGAAFGTGLGALAQLLLPQVGVSPVRWGLVGMAGLVAGATRAPITAIFIVFEITDDYRLVLPVMLVAVIAFAVARRLAPHGLYDGWLARRGEHLAHGADRSLLARVPVRRAMDRSAVTVLPAAPLEAVVKASERARQPVVPVVGADGALHGLITFPDLRQALLDRSSLADVLVAADLAELVDAVAPEAPLSQALRLMNARALDAVPVVADGGRYVGLLTRYDLVATYERELVHEV